MAAENLGGHLGYLAAFFVLVWGIYKCVDVAMRPSTVARCAYSLASCLAAWCLQVLALEHVVPANVAAALSVLLCLVAITFATIGLRDVRLRRAPGELDLTKGRGRGLAIWALVLSVPPAGLAIGGAVGAGTLQSLRSLEQTRYLASADPWVYHSQEHGVSIVLPAKHWQPSEQRLHLVDFSSSNPWLPMTAGVASIEKQTREDFQESIAPFKSQLEVQNRSRSAPRPEFQQGATESGNPYVFATHREKGIRKDEVLYMARSRTWLKDKGVAVTVVFEGRRGADADSRKDSELEKAARAICLSVN